MQLRVFGRTGMQLSVLGFGCGAVGGFMVRGDPADQERTVARAIAAGVNYFDTAVQYGDGESEKNLGRVLQKLKPANVVVGTKVRVAARRVRPHRRRGHDVARRQSGAAASRPGRHLSSAQSDYRDRRRIGAERPAGARRRGAGVRAAASSRARFVSSG